MLYVEALQEYEPTGLPSLFLGGGITDCPDWQQEMVSLLRDLPLALLNPRRPHFPIGDPGAAVQQIEWEFRHLRKATAVLFWFPCETLCPIALYELGAWSMTDKPLFVGTHPAYGRRVDVEVQTRLTRPGVAVRADLKRLADDVRRWVQPPEGGSDRASKR